MHVKCLPMNIATNFITFPTFGSAVFIMIGACLNTPAFASSPGSGSSVSKTVLTAASGLKIDFHTTQGVPLESDGIELVLEAEAPRAGLILVGRGYLFRSKRELPMGLAPLRAGENRVHVRWSAMEAATGALGAIKPVNFSELEVVDPQKRDGLKLARWRFLPNEGQPKLAPWEQIRKRSFEVRDDGWRKGIPSDGFGRFGWLQNSGLLVGELRTDGFGGEAIGKDGAVYKAFWRLQLGAATNLAWSRTHADWVHVEHAARYDLSNESKNELMEKAPELVTEIRRPQRLVGSILAPGILIDSFDRTLTLTPQAPDKAEQSAVSGSVRLLVPTQTGLRWLAAKETITGEQMAEGWFIAVWPEHTALPMLIAPKLKPSLVKTTARSLEMEFPASLERVAVGFPAGYRAWQENTTASPQMTETELADQARLLSAVLRAYPIGANQDFKQSTRGADVLEVRETILHLFWDNAWGEPARQIAPISPVLAFAQEQGYPVHLPTNWIQGINWPTKAGPYRAVEGAEIRYEIPVPESGLRIYLRPAGSDVLGDAVAAAITAANQAGHDKWLERDSLAGWWLRAPSSLALTLLNESQRDDFLRNWRLVLDRNLRPHAWSLRVEPFSGARYPVSFGWVERHTETLGDVNSGVGALLYGVWAYARSSGDWKFVEDRWGLLRGALEYFLVENDWAYFTTGAREHSGSSAIDMDGIAYEGVVAYAEMAKALGREDDEALGRFLMARLAVPTSIRWLGKLWTQPGLDRSAWTKIGVGFSEFAGFDFLPSREGGPDHASSELALSLSWVGQYPELYSLHRWALGDDFWRWFEYDYVEKKLVDWRADHQGNRNNHAANITAHLYQRALLGESTQVLRDELVKQGTWAMNPSGPTARENAPFYAMLLGRDFPVSLVSWGRAGLIAAQYDATTKRGTLTFSADRPEAVTLALQKRPLQVIVNGQETMLRFASGDAVGHFEVPAGKSNVELIF